MYDLISIGNIVVDMYFIGDYSSTKEHFMLAKGGKYFVDYFQERVGGGGANVAIGAQKLGLRTAVIAKVGRNVFKPYIIEKLQQTGVSDNLLHYDNEYMNVSAVVMDMDGERTIFNYQTPHQHLFQTEKDYEVLKRARSVYLGNLPDIYISERTKLLKYLKENSIISFLNMGVKDCRRSKEELWPLLKQAQVLIVNGHEFADIVKEHYHNLDFKESMLQKYLSDFPDLTVVITDSENGSYGYTGTKVYYQQAIHPKKVVNTTGAGDGFCSGFITEFIVSKDMQKSLESGAQYACKILSIVGSN